MLWMDFVKKRKSLFIGLWLSLYVQGSTSHVIGLLSFCTTIFTIFFKLDSIQNVVIYNCVRVTWRFGKGLSRWRGNERQTNRGHKWLLRVTGYIGIGLAIEGYFCFQLGEISLR